MLFILFKEEVWPEFEDIILRSLLYWRVVHTIESNRLYTEERNCVIAETYNSFYLNVPNLLLDNIKYNCAVNPGKDICVQGDSFPLEYVSIMI